MCEWQKENENLVLFLNGTGDVVTENMEQAEVLNAIFTPVFTSKASLQETKAQETRQKVWITLGGKGSGQGILKQIECM